MRKAHFWISADWEKSHFPHAGSFSLNKLLFIMSKTLISLFYTYIFHYCSEFSKKIKDLLWSEGELKHMYTVFLTFAPVTFFICQFVLCLCVI